VKHINLKIEKAITLRDAMCKLDHTAMQVLFVMDNDTLIGTLTDGDIRRYLLKGGSLDDSVDTATNYQPKTAENLKQARKMIQHGDYPAIPVVGKEGQLEDVVFRQRHKHVYTELHIPVVIMAGGRGTRLEPYTRVLPKPLIPVGEFPIMEHIMWQFEKYSCNSFHIIVNYKKQLLKAYFNEDSQTHSMIWYDEDSPLGTGGGLSLLKGQIQETFFFTNCDILLRADYADMLQFHRENGNTITMIGAYKNLTIPYGVIDIQEGGEVAAMREKPELSFLTNTGIYIVEPEVLEDIPEHTALGFPDIIEGQRQKGRKVAVYPVDEDAWMDMGQMTELEKMRKQLYGE